MAETTNEGWGTRNRERLAKADALIDDVDMNGAVNE
jgi:hypothetical protein